MAISRGSHVTQQATRRIVTMQSIMGIQPAVITGHHPFAGPGDFHGYKYAILNIPSLSLRITAMQHPHYS